MIDPVAQKFFSILDLLNSKSEIVEFKAPVDKTHFLNVKKSIAYSARVFIKLPPK